MTARRCLSPVTITRRPLTKRQQNSFSFKGIVEDHPYNQRILSKRAKWRKEATKAVMFNFRCHPVINKLSKSNDADKAKEFTKLWDTVKTKVELADYLYQHIRRKVKTNLRETKSFKYKGFSCLSKIKRKFDFLSLSPTRDTRFEDVSGSERNSQPEDTWLLTPKR